LFFSSSQRTSLLRSGSEPCDRSAPSLPSAQIFPSRWEGASQEAWPPMASQPAESIMAAAKRRRVNSRYRFRLLAAPALERDRNLGGVDFLIGSLLHRSALPVLVPPQKSCTSSYVARPAFSAALANRYLTTSSTSLWRLTSLPAWGMSCHFLRACFRSNACRLLKRSNGSHSGAGPTAFHHFGSCSGVS